MGTYQPPSTRFARSAPVNTANQVNNTNTAGTKQYSNPNEAAKASSLTTASTQPAAVQPTQQAQATPQPKASTQTAKSTQPTASTQTAKSTQPTSSQKATTSATGGGAQAAMVAQASQSNNSSSSSKANNSDSVNFFDVDSALNTVYNQARSAGINIAKPSTYGRTITNQEQAQRIVDNYTANANQLAQSKASSQATTTWDITSQINSIKQNAAQNGVNLSGSPQLKYSSQSAAQAALDQYYNSARAQIVQQVIKSDIAAADAALTHAEREEMDQWNRENHNMWDNPKNINPEYMIWLKRGSSGTSNPPKYIEDAYSESYESRQARQAWNSQREAQVAASQAKLKESYDITLKASGTTHAKNSTVKINTQKVAAKKVQQVTSKPSEVKIIKNPTTTTTSTPKKAGNNALAKYQNKAATETAKQAAKHEGQVQLKDGTWIDKVQKSTSGNGTSTGNVKLYTADEWTKAQKEAKAALEAAKKISDNYKETVDKNGKVIDAIQSKGSAGKGESNVRVIKTDTKGNVIAASKTATEYKNALDVATKNAAIPITPATSIKDSKAILAARDYVIQRTQLGSTALKQSKAYSEADAKATTAMLQSGGWAAPKAKSTFKTVDQLRQEKSINSDNKIASALVSADVAFKQALSYNNVKNVVSTKLNEYNTKASKALNIPTLSEVQSARDKFLSGVNVKVSQPGKETREYTLKDVQQKGSNAIYGNKYGAAVEGLVTDTYESVRTKPVSAAAQIAAIYATGAVAGAVVGSGARVLTSGAGKLAARSSGLTQKVASGVASHVQTGITAGMVAPVLYEGGKVIAEGDAAKTVNFMASLAVGGLGFSKGMKIAKDPISIIPGARTVKLQEVTAGHGTGVKDIRAGETLSFNGKDVLSFTREGKFVKGASYVPSEMTKGKIIQTFDKRNTEAFQKTVEKQAGKSAADTFASGKMIADKAYSQKRTVTNPKSLDILSEHIPEQAKSVVKQTVQDYNKLKLQSIEVYGSVAQKLQMNGYISRKPQDIEISVGNVDKFVNMFNKNAAKAGLKADKDYRITASEQESPKIEFAVGSKWKKGVEIFSNKNKVTPAEDLAGYRAEEGIAFGYAKKAPFKVDGAKMMSLQEQAGRKFAGATSLQDGSLVPVHGGRVKDIRDLIEIGTANEITFKTGIADKIISYAKATVASEPKVLDSPIAGYIVKRERVPTNKGVRALASDKFEANEKFLVAKRAEGDTSRTLYNSRFKKYSASNKGLKETKLIQSKKAFSNSVLPEKTFKFNSNKSSKSGLTSNKAASKFESEKASGKATTEPVQKAKISSKIASKIKSKMMVDSTLSKPIKSLKEIKNIKDVVEVKQGIPEQRFRKGKQAVTDRMLDKELIYESKGLRVKIGGSVKAVSKEIGSRAESRSAFLSKGSRALSSKGSKQAGRVSNLFSLSKPSQRTQQKTNTALSRSKTNKRQESKASVRSVRSVASTQVSTPDVLPYFKGAKESIIIVPSKSMNLSAPVSRKITALSKQLISRASSSAAQSKLESKASKVSSSPASKIASEASKSRSSPSSAPSSKPSTSTASRSSGSKSGSSSKTSEAISSIYVKDSPVAIKKKQYKFQERVRKQKDSVKLTRDIKNRLGSLDSMFGAVGDKSARTSSVSPTIRTKVSGVNSKSNVSRSKVQQVKRSDKITSIPSKTVKSGKSEIPVSKPSKSMQINMMLKMPNQSRSAPSRGGRSESDVTSRIVKVPADKLKRKLPGGKQISGYKYKGNIRLRRDIGNSLGGLDSMLG